MSPHTPFSVKDLRCGHLLSAESGNVFLTVSGADKGKARHDPEEGHDHDNDVPVNG